MASLVMVAWGSLSALVGENTKLSGQRESEREVLYLPSGEALEFVSFGYRNVVADLLWFKTISYFGKHYASDRNYQWLGHQCELVTRLTPKAAQAYTFCANMLSWEANLPEQSVKLLDRAIDHMPADWNMRYYRGITYLVFLNQGELALKDFQAAARLPGAPPMIARIAAKTMAELVDPSAAIEFLQGMIAHEADPSARRALEHRLIELRKKARRPL